MRLTFPSGDTFFNSKNKVNAVNNSSIKLIFNSRPNKIFLIDLITLIQASN